MSLLRLHMNDETTKMISEKIRDEFLDKIQDFDYTVFEHFKKEDQTTIQGINIDKTGNVLTLSRMLKFDYIASSNWHDHDPFRQQYNPANYRPVQIYVTPSVRIVDSKVVSLVIKYSKSDSPVPEESVFNIHVGEEKYLINQTFYDKGTFEGYVFQQSTIDKPTHFGLDYVLEIIQKLKV